MAFQPAVNTQPAASNNFVKAAAFINLWIVKPDGSRVKLGAIPLKETKAYEAALIERLSTDTEALAKMQAVLQLDFQMVSNEAIKADAVGF